MSLAGDMADHFLAKGWVRFEHHADVANWATAVGPVADRITADPEHRSNWLRCGGTWFAGVNVLPNNAAGGLPDHGVPPLSGPAVDFIKGSLGLREIAWDAAQVSVCYPGYPQPWGGESEAAFRFRRDRDAAHVDGLLPKGSERRRYLGEVHGFVLGLPLSETPADAAPLVVWEGSHEIIRLALQDRLGSMPQDTWCDEDITDAYTSARRAVFESCKRVPIHARPGEAYLIHRLALHGVAPWGEDGGANPRTIAYFRPDAAMSPGDWLNAR